ncbi:MAG: c-type cytochrome [Phycisphaerales bacterium]|nr:MAG: cytochrome c oxidase subunit II [Phycisphaerales bacterium]
MIDMFHSIPMFTTLAEADFFKKLWLRTDAASDAANHTDFVFMAIWWICVAWFVFLMVLMAYFVVRYRRVQGKPAEPSKAHNTTLEIVWTIIPTLFFVWMFFAGFKGYVAKQIAPGDAEEIIVDAKKWNWTVTYPGGYQSYDAKDLGAKSQPVFYIPAGRPLKFRLLSADVMHAFWVPDMRIKSDVFPNRYTYVWFDAKEPSGKETISRDMVQKGYEDLIGAPYADHWLFCAEYCGDDHSEMAAIFRVVPEPVYKKWLAALDKASQNMPPCELGERTFKMQCASCHSVDGSKNTGPSWKDMFGRTETFTDGKSAVVDETYVRESILYPAAKIVQGFPNSMNSFQGQLSEKQINGLIAYMKKISANYTGPDPCVGAVTPEGETPAANEALKTDAPKPEAVPAH